LRTGIDRIIRRKALTYRKKNMINIIFPAIGILVAVLHNTCHDSCAYLKGSIFGMALDYIGFFYMGALIIAHLLKKELVFLSLLSAGIGGELYLLGFQFVKGVYCYYCLAFGAILILLFLFNFERSKKVIITVSIMIGFIIFSLLFEGSVTPVYAEDTPMTSFGKGRIEVRIYTDYFCPPCRAVEPQLEPLIRSLMKKKKITLVFVDTPIHSHTPLYARYFLYALKENRDFNSALHVRSILFEAAKQDITENEKLDDFLRQKGIKLKLFDTKPVFVTLSSYLREDAINATPTCIIYANGKKEKFTGPDIIKALKGLE
jgi:thiol-disulfide isomerase/thioredoxin